MFLGGYILITRGEASIHGYFKQNPEKERLPGNKKE